MIASMLEDLLAAADREEIARRGIPLAQIEAQLRLFRDPPRPVALDRPCRVGDGIVTLREERHAGLLAAWETAARSGRFSKFVPASGAASRMFQSLSAFLEKGGAPGGDVARFLSSLDRFPFAGELLRAAGPEPDGETADGRAVRLVSALLSPEGLGYAARAKGLIPFHRSHEGTRTAFEEHLVEAAHTVRDGDGRCRVHATVAEESRPAFEALVADARRWMEPWLKAEFDVSFSVQSPATDTLAVTLDDRPFRNADGTLVFRPGGHGALLTNLAAVGGDLVYVKNVDNVVPEKGQELVVLWKRLIGGLLVTLEERARSLLRDVRQGERRPGAVDEAVAFARAELGVAEAAGLVALPRPEARRRVVEILDRPLRVAAVVRNQGEPGGGPFFTRDRSGRVSAQIVESSQVDRNDAAQLAIWESSTHFNPVDLVCSVRDEEGTPYDLDRFVDPDTVFLSRKSKDGRELKALERPGLWNGAMAGWLTVFVEVPLATFAPVKTVLDLLRPEHQG